MRRDEWLKYKTVTKRKYIGYEVWKLLHRMIGETKYTPNFHWLIFRVFFFFLYGFSTYLLRDVFFYLGALIRIIFN
jgi:hypothetical protein